METERLDRNYRARQDDAGLGSDAIDQKQNDKRSVENKVQQKKNRGLRFPYK